MALLLPRLPGPASDTILRRFLERGPDQWSGFDPHDLPEAARFAATGGTRITAGQLSDLREGLESLAVEHGFGVTSSRQALSQFDARTAAWLAMAEILNSGEALRDDVWNFIGTVLAPDIVHWRFGGAIERYVGGVRNTYQRLWMRGRALDRGAQHPGRWQLLDELTEDALVQITERPSIGGDPILALAIGEAWMRASQYHGKTAMEPIMRRAVLRIRIRNEIRNLTELSERELIELLDDAFGVVDRARSDGRRDQSEARMEYSEQNLGDGDNMHQQVSIDAAGTEAQVCSAAVRSVLQEAEIRGWLSPKSTAALNALLTSRRDLKTSEHNSLEHLLGRMSDASVLLEEIRQIRQSISAPLCSDPTGGSEPPRPRKSRWAIWRAK
ncbi:MAG: hypothetical protein RID22_05830 [Roseibium aggregatum]